MKFAERIQKYACKRSFWLFEGLAVVNYGIQLSISKQDEIDDVGNRY